MIFDNIPYGYYGSTAYKHKCIIKCKAVAANQYYIFCIICFAVANY